MAISLSQITDGLPERPGRFSVSKATVHSVHLRRLQAEIATALRQRDEALRRRGEARKAEAEYEERRRVKEAELEKLRARKAELVGEIKRRGLTLKENRGGEEAPAVPV